MLVEFMQLQFEIRSAVNKPEFDLAQSKVNHFVKENPKDQFYHGYLASMLDQQSEIIDEQN